MNDSARNVILWNNCTSTPFVSNITQIQSLNTKNEIGCIVKWAILLVLLLSMIQPTYAQEIQPTDLEIEIHELINEERLNTAKHGIELRALRLQSTLISVARAHSQDMLDNNYFAHQDLDGGQVWDRVADAGVDYDSVGENLYQSFGISKARFAESAVDGWIDSPGHYANILTSFEFTGIGVADNGDLYIVTQVFLNAAASHLNRVGQIYENDELDDIPQDSPRFEISPTLASIIVVVLIVLIGFDARRRNREYWYRRYRRA